MASQKDGFNRRDFLKRSAVAGLGVWAAASWPKLGYAASKERITILSSVTLDSLHPYAYTSSPQYGIWNHMLEGLVEEDYVKMDYVGVLAESWEFKGKHWEFNLKKGVRFHDGSPFTAKDVVYSINRIMKDPKW